MNPDDSVRDFWVDVNFLSGALWLRLHILAMLEHALIIDVEDVLFLRG